MQNNYDKSEVTYAGFWVRLAAYLLDNILLFIGLLVVRLFLLGISAMAEGTVLDGGLIFQYTWKDIILYAFHVLYFVVFTFYAGTTPGKWLMNLRLVNAAEEKLSFLDILYRETVGRFLCSVTVGIGYILAGINKEKQGLHDVLCDTRVIYAKKVKIYSVPVHPSAAMPAPVSNPGTPKMGPGPYQMVHPNEEQQSEENNQ